MHSYFIKGISLVVALLFLFCSFDSSDDNIDEPSGDSYMRAQFVYESPIWRFGVGS